MPCWSPPIFGLASLLLQSPLLLRIARWGGAAFLLWYGARALIRALRPQGLTEDATHRHAPGRRY